jgi:hypothetical protein
MIRRSASFSASDHAPWRTIFRPTPNSQGKTDPSRRLNRDGERVITKVVAGRRSHRYRHSLKWRFECPSDLLKPEIYAARTAIRNLSTSAFSRALSPATWLADESTFEDAVPVSPAPLLTSVIRVAVAVRCAAS